MKYPFLLLLPKDFTIGFNGDGRVSEYSVDLFEFALDMSHLMGPLAELNSFALRANRVDL